MTGPHTEAQSPSTRPISVAELLAKNEMIGAPPVSGRRRRRRGNSEAVTVAELTGEIPVITDDDHHDETAHPTRHSHRPNGGLRLAEPVVEASPEPVDEIRAVTPYWAESEPRWPESAPLSRPESGPPLSAYPRPARQTDAERTAELACPPEPTSGAEGMSPDPMENYADVPVDVMAAEVRDAEPSTEDSAFVRSYLGTSVSGLSDPAIAGQRLGEPVESAQFLSAVAGLDEDDLATLDESGAKVEDAYAPPARAGALLGGGLIVLQSILAVALGAGLFIAFDELWRWNNVVALVLAVLVILGLVVGVRVVRKTEDIASTLIAVAVGALVTLGPLALLQSG